MTTERDEKFLDAGFRINEEKGARLVFAGPKLAASVKKLAAAKARKP